MQCMFITFKLNISRLLCMPAAEMKIDNYLTATLTKQWSSRPEGVYFAIRIMYIILLIKWTVAK